MIVTIYTQPTCSKCQVIKEKLTSANIEYREIDDIEVMSKMGIEYTPVLEVGGKLLNFSEANRWIQEVKSNG